MEKSDSIFILLDKKRSIIHSYEINDTDINLFESYNLTDPSQKSVVDDTFLTPIISHSAMYICNDIPVDYIKNVINKDKPYYLLTYIEFEKFPPKNYGFLLAYHKSPTEVYIHVICSKKGFGGKLLKYFIRYIKEKVPSVNTISLSALTEVVGFYLINGFTIRNTCEANPINVSSENIQQLRQNSVNIKNLGLNNLNAYSGSSTKFKMNRMKTSSRLLYKLYQDGIFADYCNPGMSYEEFLYSRCFGEGIHMVYCLSENKVVPSFSGRLPNVPVVVNDGNENSFGNMKPGNYPPFPQKLINEAQREYTRRWKLGGTRKRNERSHRTQKKHGKK